MTRQEAIQILSILKAAYPNSYKGMTKDEANGTINIWATQFNNVPFDVITIAVNKLISTNTFPPSINEVKEKIRALYWEAYQMLDFHNRYGAPLPAKCQECTIWEDSIAQLKKCGSVKCPREYTDEMRNKYRLDDKSLAIVKKIIKVCEPWRTQQNIEPSLGDLLQGYNAYLADGSSDKKQISGGA